MTNAVKNTLTVRTLGLDAKEFRLAFNGMRPNHLGLTLQIRAELLAEPTYRISRDELIRRLRIDGGHALDLLNTVLKNQYRLDADGLYFSHGLDALIARLTADSK